MYKNSLPSRYIRRGLEPTLIRAAAQFPAVVLTGPRQSGKTTLLQTLFGETHGYISLELPDIRAAAIEDPRGFLERFQPPVIFDEVQHAPALLPYVKEQIDRHRSRTGQYLLTGSQNLLLMERITESLAGRTAVLRLLPLARREVAGDPTAPLPWVASCPRGHAIRLKSSDLWAELFRGGYPELAADVTRDIQLWHASYVQTYLERDVRSLRQVGDLTQFQSFLRALAARSTQLLNLTELGRDLGLAVNTVKAWLSVLEATDQILILRPYHANISKRLVKTPKVYFTDTGTLCYLTGLRDPAHAAAGPMGGAIFETAVLSEIVKAITHQGESPRVYFWRTATGGEVDIVVESGGRLVPLEVKLSATPKLIMADGIRALRSDLGDRVAAGYVVHPGELQLPLGAHASAFPFAGL